MIDGTVEVLWNDQVKVYVENKGYGVTRLLEDLLIDPSCDTRGSQQPDLFVPEIRGT